MPFSPDTEIHLFKATGVSDNDQPYFADQGSKMSWYASHSPLIFTAQSYQRERRAYCRLNAPAAQLRDYDMLAYRNAAGDRWIICRITGTEFVNPNTTDVFFAVDPMQTWIDTIQWCDCWVEREMVEDDWNGAVPAWKSLMPEGVETGQLKSTILHDFTSQITANGWRVRVLSAYDINAEENYSVKNTGGYISGLNEFELTSTGQIDTMLKAYADKGRLDGICGIWMFPNAFPGTGTILRATVTLPRIIDGYEIKNSKCLTSEFSTVCISNRAGDSIELAPEYLFGESNQAGFGVVGSFLDGGGGMTCQPMDYMDIGSTGSGNLSYDYGVSIPANIQVAYVGNAFANWVAQNRVPLILEGVASLGQIVVGAGQVWAGTGAADDRLVAEGARSGISGASSALGTIAKIMQKASDPAGAHGQAYSQALGVVFDAVGFVVSLRTPSRQVLESIDNFFDVYGYKVCRMKKPNVNTRPFWNYVKCAPGIVNGPMNSNDRTEIENMLTQGVTFWNVSGGAVIGDYSMDNRG